MDKTYFTVEEQSRIDNELADFDKMAPTITTEMLLNNPLLGMAEMYGGMIREKIRYRIEA